MAIVFARTTIHSVIEMAGCSVEGLAYGLLKWICISQYRQGYDLDKVRVAEVFVRNNFCPLAKDPLPIDIYCLWCALNGKLKDGHLK